MKQLSLAIILVLIITPLAFASGEPIDCDDEGLKETEAFRYYTHCYDDADTDTNTHNKKIRGNQEFGGKATLWKHDKFDITHETAWDSANGRLNNKTLLEYKTDIGILQKVGDWLKGLFNKED